MSLADCCGCAARGGDLHSGTVDAVAPFKLGVKAIEMLNQPGKDEENRAALAAAGGSQGLVVALCSDPEKGIAGTPGEPAARVDSSSLLPCVGQGALGGERQRRLERRRRRGRDRETSTAHARRLHACSLARRRRGSACAAPFVTRRKLHV